LNLKDYCKSNPTRNVVPPKIKKSLPLFFKENELELAIDLFDGTDFKSKMSRLIIDLFYQTGIRCSELINLKDSDLNFFNNTITVVGKRNKQRIVPIGNDLKNTIKDYILFRYYLITYKFHLYNFHNIEMRMNLYSVSFLVDIILPILDSYKMLHFLFDLTLNYWIYIQIVTLNS
jgi:site-specific recombinase XerD